MKHYLKGIDTMKITIGDLRDMRGADMPIILQDCKYIQGYAQKLIEGPWGWMVHCGDCDAMRNNDYIANDDMGFHFLYGGLDYVEVDTDSVTISCDGIFVSKPTIWVEENDVVEASEQSKYLIEKALGDGFNVREWDNHTDIKWFRTFEDAKSYYNDLNGWND
jgi:hypothetical protein